MSDLEQTLAAKADVVIPGGPTGALSASDALAVGEQFRARVSARRWPMHDSVAGRGDAEALWNEFCIVADSAWYSSEQLRFFVRGWDARRRTEKPLA